MEFEAVAAHLPEYLKDFARFAFITAWRKSEVASLRWADVDVHGGLIRLREEASKNGQPRFVTLEGPLAALMERRWAARQVFATPEGIRIADLVFHRDGRKIGDIRKAWASACEKAGLRGRLFHDLRRSGVRCMVRSGVQEKTAMDISGHRSRNIFDRYNITSEGDVREALRKTQSYLERAPAERTVLPFRKAQEGSE